ncbi:hypothetical protein ONZ51_g3053 [Trametes cubensis]|uniref:DUF6533 domain-containing protein n=1 Tax=Trametes cubensis TaxID=1111947 RepID=A0AAD7TYF4_9APHY|nr:hypothetical protein ONZ51_g3053 [Trametes cubensis]
MASGADAAAAAQEVLLYQAAQTNIFWTSSAMALLIYDYLLTLRHEVRFVWSRKFTGATVLFLLNRYTIILLYLVDVITLFPIIPKVVLATVARRNVLRFDCRCPGTGRFITVLEVLPYIIWAAFSSLRAYALSSRNLPIGLLIFLLSLVPAGVNAYFFSTFSFIELPAPSNCTALSDITAQLSKTYVVAVVAVPYVVCSQFCAFSSTHPSNQTLLSRRRVTIVSRASLMAADTLVIVVTWASTYRIGKASRDARLGFSFGTLLLRDGTIYFVVLVAMNVVHMTLNVIKPNDFVQQASYVTVLENPITSILVSRFILNLRAVDHRGGGGGGMRTDTADDTLRGHALSTSPSFVRSDFLHDSTAASGETGVESERDSLRERAWRWRRGEGAGASASVVDEFGEPVWGFGYGPDEDGLAFDASESWESKDASGHGLEKVVDDTDVEKGLAALASSREEGEGQEGQVRTPTSEATAVGSTFDHNLCMPGGPDPGPVVETARAGSDSRSY